MKILDNSSRSRYANVWTIIVLVAITLMFLGLVTAPFTYYKYKNVVNNSSFPIGTEMTFERSDASVVLKNIYTDKNKDVLIVQLSEEEGGGATLPYKGTDYSIFLHSKSLKGYEKADILFGRLSTDGDLFLVIPKPTDDVYTVYIMNNNYINTVARQSSTSTSGTLDSSQYVDEEGNFDKQGYANSISKELSSYTYYGEDDIGSMTNSVQVADDSADIIAMRLTLNPAFDTKEYQPTVIKESLLTEDNKFDFETFFNEVFRQTAVNDLQKQYDALSADIKQFEENLVEFENRYRDNPNDIEAETTIGEIESEIKAMEQEQDDILNRMTEYNLYDYDEELFRNLNTEATIAQ